MTDDASLAGQVMTDVPLADVADAFRRAGLDAHYHANPHGGEEVCVDTGDADCLVEPRDPGEYLVCDAGGERAALEEMARTMSAVLTGMGIRHRLELYDEDDREMFAYLHHAWPLD
jgi:oxalate decarboxylase/phosphoglucose isomerase-like protein (cupin superfamily)